MYLRERVTFFADERRQGSHIARVDTRTGARDLIAAEVRESDTAATPAFPTALQTKSRSGPHSRRASVSSLTATQQSKSRGAGFGVLGLLALRPYQERLGVL